MRKLYWGRGVPITSSSVGGGGGGLKTKGVFPLLCIPSKLTER